MRMRFAAPILVEQGDGTLRRDTATERRGRRRIAIYDPRYAPVRCLETLSPG